MRPPFCTYHNIMEFLVTFFLLLKKKKNFSYEDELCLCWGFMMFGFFSSPPFKFTHRSEGSGWRCKVRVREDSTRNLVFQCQVSCATNMATGCHASIYSLAQLSLSSGQHPGPQLPCSWAGMDLYLRLF